MWDVGGACAEEERETAGSSLRSERQFPKGNCLRKAKAREEAFPEGMTERKANSRARVRASTRASASVRARAGVV
jgi:hypothetical protein